MILKVKWKTPIILVLLLFIYNLPDVLLTAGSRKRRPGVPCGPLRTSSSEKDDCYRRSKQVICPNISIPGTVIKKYCRFPYNLNKNETASYSCNREGEWVPLVNYCQSDCGRVTSNNEYPWIAALYDSDEKLICSGAIISPYHVVMDVQCIAGAFADKYGKINFENYTIIAGKHYTNIHRQRNSQQTRKIKQKVKRSGYTNWMYAKKESMLLVEVDEKFEFLDVIQPICLDWQSIHEDWDYKDTSDGIIVGWKYHKDEVVPCSSRVQYWKTNTCRENLYRDFRRHFLEDDKSCAVYTEDENICARNDGMGILLKPVLGRYFLMGVASIIDAEWGLYVIYIQISSYFDWLRTNMKKNKGMAPYFETFGKQEYDTVGHCILPKQVEYGRFSLVAGEIYPEGTRVPSDTVVDLLCSDNKTSSFRCTKNDWQPMIDTTSLCKRPGSCPSLKSSESEEVFCKLKDEFISCDEPPANTIAVIVCQEFYYLSGQKPIYKCQDEKWDPPFRSCSLECGSKRMGEPSLPTNVTEAVRNEYPWIVAIYKDYIQLCAGTLITRRHILSAAHCFEDSTVRFGRIHEYWFTAGKHFRDFNTNEPGIQSRTEAKLYVYIDYYGFARRYRFDIALIELDQGFIISLKVQPVCIDWESTFEDVDFTNSKMGVAVGWEFTDGTESVSHVLKNLAVPFQPKEVCLKNLPEDSSYLYATVDKVCAGYSENSTIVCKNDGGGGLYYKSDGKHYFLRGIASLAMKTAVGCDKNHYTLYTKVSRYLSWIENLTRKIL